MSNITATVIADSISAEGHRITTLEIEYPRFILAEVNTHRMLSRNTASSRAIPTKKLHQLIKENPAMPVYWGKNQPGMKAKEEIEFIGAAKCVWKLASYSAIFFSKALSILGVHKQITNRILEPWMMVKTIVTSTEWANLLHLRDHKDAQPEFRDLAHKIRMALDNSSPKPLSAGEWHVPYVNTGRVNDLQCFYHDNKVIPLETALVLSASCCAQVSYRALDDSLEKARNIYSQLILSEPMHASPVEHQATPIASPKAFGVSHIDSNSVPWSGNFRGWIQYRKTLPGEAKW